MGFITKNANVILLFLILVSATALVGATVFFQMNFERINTEYNQKIQQLQVVSNELQTQQALLNKIKSELSLKAAREEELGERFTEVKETKEQLETTKAQLERSKEQLEEELESTESSLRGVQLELDAKADALKVVSDENTKLETQLDVCGDQRSDYKDERDDCLTEKAACTCP